MHPKSLYKSLDHLVFKGGCSIRGIDLYLLYKCISYIFRGIGVQNFRGWNYWQSSENKENRLTPQAPRKQGVTRADQIYFFPLVCLLQIQWLSFSPQTSIFLKKSLKFATFRYVVQVVSQIYESMFQYFLFVYGL